MIHLNKLFRLFLAVLIPLAFSSCHIPLIYMHSLLLDKDEDYSNREEYQDIINQTYTLKEDIFLSRYPGEYKIHLSPVGSLCLPSSIDAFLNDPDNWMFSDDNAKKGDDPNKWGKDEVLGVLEKGTLLRVKKILCETRASTGQIIGIVVKICSGKHTGKIFFGKKLFDRDYNYETGYGPMYPKVKYLKKIDPDA